jgi:hypothetical protein
MWHQRTVNFSVVEKEQLNNYLALGNDHIHCFHKYWRRLLGLFQVQNLKYRRVILRIIM